MSVHPWHETSMYYFFMLGRDQYGLYKKRVSTRYVELVFLHPVGSAVHIVHSGATRARNMDTLFLILGWNWDGFDKKHAGTCYVELVFCIWWDLWVT
jgi:hypothetical protein